ncbi:MAG: hypothetical protein AB1750_17165 [Chloroflexota bacterium]
MDVIQTFETRRGAVQLTAYESAAPAKSSRARSVKAPGAGKFEIESVALSSEKISAGDSLTLEARLAGKGIAYLFTDILLRDPQRDQYYGPIVRDFVLATRARTTGGVTRPQWDSALELSISLRLNLRLLTDRRDATFGFFLPAGYGDPDSYLEGLYTPADGAASRRARLTVGGDGAAKKMVAFKEGARLAAPSALTLKPGDQFAPFAQVLTRKGDDWQTKTCLVSSLTFRGEPFHWEEQPLLPGEYLAGILAQDMDGGLTRKYVPMKVK